MTEDLSERICRHDNGGDARQIVTDANCLARKFLRAMGFECPEGHRFENDGNPRAQQAWFLAEVAFEHLLGTELSDAVADLDDDDGEQAI